MPPKLGVQFCYELAFGVLISLSFVPKAPVGALFYRVMGGTALVLLVGGVGLAIGSGRGWTDVGTLAALAAIAAFPVYSGPLKGSTWAAGAGVGICGAAVATSAELLLSLDTTSLPMRSLACLSALATGMVAGSVGLAMVLGHWYLTVPNLSIQHLQRLNRVAVASMCASLVLVALLCLLSAADLNARQPPLLGPWGLFYLGTRITVGLVMPLGFAWMAASSLRYKNTRSATGILYASTVLVLIGTAIAISLQGSYGLPL
jgi:hypothetical protein